MSSADHIAASERLEPFLGTWELEVSLPGAEGIASRVDFERGPGGAFVVQRWEIDVPEAPDGLAVLGLDPETGHYTQHYFDSRGVARVYAMEFDGRTWKLERTAADFTPLDFAQRYSGTFTDDRSAIEGRWEIRHDGETWETDFDITYRRV